MKFDTFIFDFDGTLYPQFPVRLFMAICLIMHYVFRPKKIHELFVLMTYRKMREERYYSERNEFRMLQVRKLSDRYGIDSERVNELIHLWMNQKPLKAIKFFRRRRLIDFMKELQLNGKKIIVYSDYPVKDKLNIIDFMPDYYYCSDDEIINCMKPDSSGILRVINTLGINSRKCLYIGDREDRDGLCAKSAGVSYMDVKDFMKNFCRKEVLF